MLLGSLSESCQVDGLLERNFEPSAEKGESDGKDTPAIWRAENVLQIAGVSKLQPLSVGSGRPLRLGGQKCPPNRRGSKLQPFSVVPAAPCDLEGRKCPPNRRGSFKLQPLPYFVGGGGAGLALPWLQLR
jgi:hypothetical protein